MLRKSNLFRGLTCLFMFLLIVFLLASSIFETNRTMVDQTFGTQSTITITEEDDGSLFTAFPPDEDFLTDGKLDTAKDLKIHKDLSIAIQEEGSVLLKNNGALPLSGNAKVTMFGRRGYDSGRNSAAIVDGLIEAGLQINPTIRQIYTTFTGIRGNSLMAPGWASNKTYDFKYDPKEASPAYLAEQNADYANSFTEYNDAAIVVLGRSNGEGADYKPGTEGVADGVGSRNALALSTNERDIVKLACDNFEKVIVLINTVSPMEIEELKDNDKIDSIMYIGLPATFGAIGIGNLLTGKANPSGGLYDLYASNTASSPAMMNFGHFEFTNKDQIDRYDTSSIGTRGTDPGFKAYLIEAEGMYVGYRYYETRYYDAVTGNAGAKSEIGKSEVYNSATGTYAPYSGSWKYDEEVTYGFGYGISYTDFEMTLGELKWNRDRHEMIATLPVTVKNVGNVAGKTPVQIYAQSPYTEYDKTNGVEKSAIQLVTFEKTGLIAPGASETINAVIDLQEMANYDHNKAETYIMEASKDYYFAVGNGAHDALNNILAAQGKTTADGMDYNGKAALAVKWEYRSATDGAIDDFTFAVSKAGVKVTNRLEYNTWDDYEKGKVTYLTRKDWNGTWPKTYTDMTAPALMIEHYNGHVIDYKTKDSADKDDTSSLFDNASPNNLKFAHLIKAEYDDPRWTELIDQISAEEAILYAIESGRGFAPISSIGVPEGRYAENGPGTPIWFDNDSTEPQAPWKVAKPDGSYSLGSFPTYAVIASTFSRALSKEYGRVLANDAIFGEKPMLWLPGANTHRTPYNGRSEQYYSEDPVLTGVMTMEATVGALDKGAIVTAKHFAFNDQEMHRSGVGTFMTEQRAREIELRAFQIAFEANKYDTDEKDVGMLGVMTSFSKLGGIECTVNKGLLTGILAGEWDFKGYMVSDLKDDLDLMPQAFLAGLGGYDWRTFEQDVEPWMASENFIYDAEVMKAIKEVVHKKLYTFANSSFMNRVNATTHSEWNMTWWRALYITGIVVSAVLLAASAIMFIVSVILKKKGGN